MVGPLRAISFSVSRIKEDEEEYNPWHVLAEVELMVRSWISASCSTSATSCSAACA